MAPRETKNNAYAKFWGDKQRALWYVMVFSGVVNTDSTKTKIPKNKIERVMVLKCRTTVHTCLSEIDEEVVLLV